MADGPAAVAPGSEAASPPGEAAPAPARRSWLKSVIALVVLGGLGAGGWFIAPRVLHRTTAPAEAKPAPVVVKATVPLGAVVVNVLGQTRRYVRVSLSLGVPNAKDVKEVEESKAQLLDLVIAVLASREAEALAREEGREKVKAELLERIHHELKLEHVARVYFTEFVIQ
jgi:flagellar basal body-associated protein FliL